MKEFKNTTKLALYVFILSAFGGFLRWLQNQSAFEAETGLMVPGAIKIHIPAMMLIAAAVMYAFVRRLKNELPAGPKDAYGVFNATSMFYPLTFYIIALLYLLGGFVTFSGAGRTAAPVLYMLLGIVGFVCGITVPMLCKCARKHYAPRFVAFIMVQPILLFALWLVTSYKVNASRPALWSYAVEIIAAAVVLVSFYYNAGFAYGVPNAHRSVFFSMLGAFMCCMTLSDAREPGMYLMLAATAILLVLEAWLVVKNLGEAVSEETSPEGETVLEPGSETPDGETTKVAPGRGEK